MNECVTLKRRDLEQSFTVLFLHATVMQDKIKSSKTAGEGKELPEPNGIMESRVCNATMASTKKNI